MDALTVTDLPLIPSSQLDVNTEVKKKAFREAVGSAHIGAGITLPTAAESNIGDVRIFTQPVDSGLSWRDITDPAGTITSARAGDVAVYFDARLGWTRVGNILSEDVVFLDDGSIPASEDTLNKLRLYLGRLYICLLYTSPSPRDS